MAEVNIYRLSKTSWYKSFPKLLENIIAKGNRVYIFCQNQQLLESLDESLWSYEQLSFLPHATTSDPRPADQPILLSSNINNINNANILAIIGNAIPDNIISFEKIIYMYEANDVVAKDFIQNKIPALKEMGIKLNYYNQNSLGAWEKDATTIKQDK